MCASSPRSAAAPCVRGRGLPAVVAPAADGIESLGGADDATITITVMGDGEELVLSFRGQRTTDEQRAAIEAAAEAFVAERADAE